MSAKAKVESILQRAGMSVADSRRFVGLVKEALRETEIMCGCGGEFVKEAGSGRQRCEVCRRLR